MGRFFGIIVLLFLPILCSGQDTSVNEGLVVNNTLPEDWEGINVPRANPLKYIFQNNSITSVNSRGYLIQAGDEAPMPTNNNLDGAIISGNRLIWNGSDASSITHGMFMGYNINYTVRYNYLDKTPYGILFKSGNDAGVNMTYSQGYGAFYNIVRNARLSLRMKGINGVSVFNNTFYSSLRSGALILIDANHDRLVPAPSKGARIKNNIFYTVNPVYNISIESGCLTDFESDYNIFYCESGPPMFEIDGVPLTFSQWQAKGFDRHSVVLNPNFNNTNDFVPASRLNYGTDLGQSMKSGLSVNARWTPGQSPATTDQNGIWQPGAVIYDASATANLPPVIVIRSPASGFSGFTGEIDASETRDQNGDALTFEWLVPANIPVSATTGPKIRYLGPAVTNPVTYEFTLKVSDGKAIQIKKIPVAIVPYKPNLDAAEIAEVEAAGYVSPDHPVNILDGNTETKWSANGDNQWLILELKENFKVQHFKIAFQPEADRQFFFDLFGSEDKTNWDPILLKSASCGFSGDLHVFDVPQSKTGKTYRYIKLVGRTNSVDSWNHISEFGIFGYRDKNPSTAQDQPFTIYPNPAKSFISLRINDSGLNPEFIKILTLTGTIVFRSEISSGTRNLQFPVTLQKGIYIVMVGTGEIIHSAQKLIVQP